MIIKNWSYKKYKISLKHLNKSFSLYEYNLFKKYFINFNYHKIYEQYFLNNERYSINGFKILNKLKNNNIIINLKSKSNDYSKNKKIQRLNLIIEPKKLYDSILMKYHYNNINIEQKNKNKKKQNKTIDSEIFIKPENIKNRNSIFKIMVKSVKKLKNVIKLKEFSKKNIIEPNINIKPTNHYKPKNKLINFYQKSMLLKQKKSILNLNNSKKKNSFKLNCRSSYQLIYNIKIKKSKLNLK